MSEQAATQGGDQSTADERQRAAEAESYGGQPIDSEELADVWTAGNGVESHAGGDRPAGDSPGSDTPGSDTSGGDSASGDVVSDPAQGDEVGSDWSDEGGATPAGPATDEPTD